MVSGLPSTPSHFALYLKELHGNVFMDNDITK